MGWWGGGVVGKRSLAGNGFRMRWGTGEDGRDVG